MYLPKTLLGILVYIPFFTKLQYIRCAQSDFGVYNVTEPPIDAPRGPLYKTDREIQKVRIHLSFIYRRSNISSESN